MLVGVFKSNNRLLGLVAVVLCAIVWLPSLFIDPNNVLVKESLISNKWLNYLFGVILVCGQAIYLNYVVGKHKLIPSFNYLIVLVYVLLNALLCDVLMLSEVHLANTFILLAFNQLFIIYNANEAKAQVFNFGLFLGIAIIIYSPLIVLFPVFLFSVAYLKQISIKEQLIAIIGGIIPFAYWLSYLFIIDEVASFDQRWLMENRVYALADVSFQLKYVVLYFIDLLVVLSFLNAAIHLRTVVVKTRKVLMVIIIALLAGVFSLLLNDTDYLGFYLISVPTSTVVIALFLDTLKRKWVAELLVFGLLFCIGLNYFL